jgi:hypothetical protein
MEEDNTANHFAVAKVAVAQAHTWNAQLFVRNS